MCALNMQMFSLPLFLKQCSAPLPRTSFTLGIISNAELIWFTVQRRTEWVLCKYYAILWYLHLWHTCWVLKPCEYQGINVQDLLFARAGRNGACWAWNDKTPATLLECHCPNPHQLIPDWLPRKRNASGGLPQTMVSNVSRARGQKGYLAGSLGSSAYFLIA